MPIYKKNYIQSYKKDVASKNLYNFKNLLFSMFVIIIIMN